MVHARAEDHSEDEEECHAGVKCPRYDRVQTRLACRADKGQDGAQEVELCNLCLGKRKATQWEEAQLDDERVESRIRPAPDGILGRVLPRLQSIAVVEVVRRLPVVEDLVTVLDGREKGSGNIGSGEDVEGNDGLELEWRFLRWSWGFGCWRRHGGGASGMVSVTVCRGFNVAVHWNRRRKLQNTPEASTKNVSTSTRTARTRPTSLPELSQAVSVGLAMPRPPKWIWSKPYGALRPNPKTDHGAR
jgi:hypothetical protein